MWSVLLFASCLSYDMVMRASAASIKFLADASPAATKDRDLAKVQKIEHALEGLSKQGFAPNGTQSLLGLLHKAETDLNSGGTDAHTAVMKRVGAAMATFQAQMGKRQMQLKKESEKAEVEKAANMKTIVEKIQARLDRINSAEKDARARAKAKDDQEGKLKLGNSKTDKMLKYFAKKSARSLRKKLASWASERSALTDAIRFAKIGDVDGTKAALDKAMHIAGGSQDFLH
mmetsp:Transcript_19043/g.30951  ORF Transcript_19043/g.30951 Transcript_19043/m.30951 type:complete len:231 (-) Transcript_19043:124-816(-)